MGGVFGGDYGPFKVVLVAENGEKVEDVIVELVHFEVGNFMSWKSTYRQVLVGNTGEVMLFPRGNVVRTDAQRITMGYVISHPFYHHNDVYGQVSFDNKTEGVIELKLPELVTFLSGDKRSNEITTKHMRAQGKSEAQIAQEIEKTKTTTLSTLHYVINHFFTKAAKLNRDDLVDKYLLRMIQMVADETKDTKVDVNKMEAEFREKIKINVKVL
jgi:hypothetical protein